MNLTPNSWGSLKEFNQCHSVDGKFCATHGLTSGTRMKRDKYLGYDKARAKRLGIEVVTRYGQLGRSHAVALKTPPKVTLVYGEGSRSNSKRTRVVSTLRHEIGHVTDRAYGRTGDKSEDLVFGRSAPRPYISEIGAWKAAIRDAPHNRVDWGVVQSGLLGHLLKRYASADLNDLKIIAASHTALLKRYGRKLRNKTLAPKTVLDRAIYSAPGWAL